MRCERSAAPRSLVAHVLALAALGACVEPAAVICDGLVCPPGSACLPGGGCADVAQLAACADLAQGDACVWPGVGDGVCIGGACVLSRCGNGNLDPGEVCDDGNETSGDGCSATCTSDETCGNGVPDVIVGETCDLGPANADAPDAGCRTTCLLPACGDGITDPGAGEACDQGPDNSDAPDGDCRTNCQPARCSDGIVDVEAGEVCDDGNLAPADGCAYDCRSDETCGNGIVDFFVGEECDDGALNSDAPDASCRLACVLLACGDGVVDVLAGEACDAGVGNSDAPDAPCRPSCQPARCSDGVVDVLAGEVCDDGNLSPADGCAYNCQSDESCGNGTIDYFVGETCDDGNAESYDGCALACAPDRPPVWVQHASADPSRRYSGAMAYDPHRRRIVLFGGRSQAGALDDTWEWDGRAW
jgi:cysteine-rich repeat protein